MSVLLLPRLTALGISNILESVDANQLTPIKARAIIEDGASMLSYAASGGSRSEDLAIELGRAIRDIAIRSGFPENSSQVARSRFDHEAAIYLASHPELGTGESLRDDVWSYLATVIAPDIVAWRYPDCAPHRFSGGVRNTLQRLWSRGQVLDRGEAHPDRWGLVRSLSEDAAVQIFERPSVAGNVPLAMAIAEEWVAMAAKVGRGRMEPIMRRATKLVRLRNEIVDIAGLPAEARKALVAHCFELARASLEN
ncbi:hypothetical protein [Pseudoxanthomonas sp.]|jgi:hypothetical protein|uniref:hypothetical protein n=1 Tax=Pseudoxanthomonas sp. TaxID=1871049 RepID=UPI002E0EA4E6|nr:hypothetical protein [Pseudoxanthomonas sp.]